MSPRCASARTWVIDGVAMRAATEATVRCLGLAVGAFSAMQYRDPVTLRLKTAQQPYIVWSLSPKP